jgi:general secretion pathway protein J
MVVAIGIFAVIAAISYATLDRFLEASRRLEAHAEFLRELQLAFLQLERDLRFVVNRPVRDGIGETEPALLADPSQPPEFGELIRLTTSQPHVEGSGQRLRRVAWRFDEGVLSRVTWSELDRDFDTPERARTVMADVAAVELGFWHRDAGNELTRSEEWTATDALPQAVEIVVDTGDERRYRRLLLLPGAG